MARILWLLLAASVLCAQVVVERVAGVAPRNGVHAWDIGMAGIGTTFDASGNTYIPNGSQILRRHPDGIVDVVAGTGETGFSGDGGFAIQAKLGVVGNMRFDAAGNLYFVDVNNARIRRIDTKGSITTVAGNGIPYVDGMDMEGRADQVPIAEGYYTFAVDPAGNVYLAENSAVMRADTSGNFRRFAGKPGLCMYCTDGDGGPAINATMSNIRFVAVDGAGQVYVSNNVLSAAIIRKVGLDGIITRVNAPTFAMNGFTVDKAGNVYTAEGGPSMQIRKTTPDGTRTATVLIDHGTLTTDGDGRAVYVRDNAVYSADTGQLLRTYVNGVVAPPPDGALARETPMGTVDTIASNRAGEVLFFEDATCRVRKIDAEGKFRTVAGTGKCGEVLPNLPPSNMTVGLDGTIYLRGNGYTFRIGANGAAEVIPTPVNAGPDIAVDGKGRLYFMDPNRLLRMDLDGSVTGVVVPPANGVSPQGLGRDPFGNVYFATETSIFKIEDDARYTKVLDARVSRTFSVDRAGRVWTGSTVIDAAGSRGVGPSSGFLAYSTLTAAGDLYIVNGSAIYNVTGLGQRQTPVVATNSIVNAVSYAGGSVAPGELISIFGSNFGVTGLQSAIPVNNRLPLALSPIQVWFDGQPGAIAAATATQINVFVPASVAGKTEVKIAVQVDDALSPAVTLPVRDTVFGLAAADSSGRGQGAILNANGTLNSRSNPAAPGSIIVLFGTGEGPVTPQAIEGSLNITTPYPVSKASLSVKIGGQQAEILYSGGAPTLPIGVYQINARIPQATPPGDVNVEVVAASGATSNAVTVAVQ
ncbi:MAG: hypothetical protein WDO18_09825 [Acidobacteriota bacterium]